MHIAAESSQSANVETRSWEVVERKGTGHPDTLADAIAERVSSAYSQYCLQEFGLILHHNADKTSLLGGRSRVQFGGGELLAPIQVNINGRFSTRFGSHEIPCEDIITTAAREYLGSVLTNMDPKTGTRIAMRNSTASSPGFVDTGKSESSRQYWFEPRSVLDLPDATRSHSNDTSCGVGYAPLSALEQHVLDIETTLNSAEFKFSCPAVGTDIKVMAMRTGSEIDLTIAVPGVDRHLSSVDDYSAMLNDVRGQVERLAVPDVLTLRSLQLNARDDLSKPELYLTVTGSSIESGDEGVVGRGNRTNGLITPCRIMSIEGACGKNPRYHVGKLYNVVATEVAETLHLHCGEHVTVALVSTTGTDLTVPHFVGVWSSGRKALPQAMIATAVDDVFERLDKFRRELVFGKRLLY